MKQRYFLIATITLCCLALLLSGRQLFNSARVHAEADAPVLIEAVHYIGYSYQQPDEAVALRNPSAERIDVGSWGLSDNYSPISKIPVGTMLEPYSLTWVAADAAAFQKQFGFAPDVTLARWPGFADAGDEVLLLNQYGEAIDTVVYGGGDASTVGWTGAAVQPYTVRGVFGKDGQILFRKLNQATGLPIPDSDRAADWAQERSDAVNGRRVSYPGWDRQQFFFPVREERPASLTVAIAPDNALHTVVDTIDSAQTSLKIVTLTFENLTIANALVAAAERGVAVTVLLEGSPVGGVTDQEKAICQRIELAGGQCWFMISDPGAHIYDRYRYLHAKYAIIDGQRALVSSENMSPNSMPADDKRDGTWGRRGVIFITDAIKIVDALEDIFARDLDPASHSDLFRWRSDHPDYGAPPAGFSPIQSSGGITYTVRYPSPRVFQDALSFELQQAPENLLRDEDGILGLVGRAGLGDTLLIQQLQERPHWGASTSSREEDPNLRLESFIGAARRGATVRFLLDSYFDDPRSPVSNTATCKLLNELARDEQIHVECALANPAGLGIHNKMILAHIDGAGYVQVGSWNGSELASKGNREVTLLARSDAAYAYLAQMFEGDWPHQTFLPAVLAKFRGPAAHVLISEVLYDPYGPDASEFIEIVNPTYAAVDLSGYSLGDAVSRDDFEDVRRFPEGTILSGGTVIVVATSAIDFFEQFHKWPDFEILETTTVVSNLIDDPTWGDTAALLRLGNQGDEVILRDNVDGVIDVVTYGSGSFPGQAACPLLLSANHSLERFPFWHDSDNCAADFRDWPFPSPGVTP